LRGRARDGLNPVLADEDWVVAQVETQSISRATQQLLQRASEVGLDEDATVIVVRVGSEPETRLLTLPTHAGLFHPMEFGFAE